MSTKKTLFDRLQTWFTMKTICAWHKPRPIRLRGWPWARQTSHGCCRACYRRLMAWDEPQHDALVALEERR